MPATTDSTFLAERLIARLSPQRRSNLMGRITGRALEASDAVIYGNLTESDEAIRRSTLRRTERMLGRLSALTA